MAVKPIEIKEVFNQARNISSAEDRMAFLQNVCADDPVSLQRILDLLEVYAQEKSFLEQPAVPLAPTIEQPVTERPGMQIGPYKLLQEIGHGGMGMVFMAEQHEPVRRKVALKIIKPGMDSRQVLARFEAERQALSLMDHPNIAKVLDAGTTSSARPYFVMELVKGQPITQYCDENKLTPRERLELLLPVCHAIQHAHQKGIIHRDIKPSNILVAEYDQKPVPKVIDFGVAKATSQPLTEKTMFTGFGQVVGTLEYMSPEQAKVNQLDIDTRSDIYSLGVLMYELLTGSTPFDRKRLKQAAWDEMLRIIREEDPPKPSTRLFDSKDSLPSISAQRHTEPAKLTKLVRGELDWIVMKALEKDRNRRYETANGLAMDLLRYLNDEAVSACPPSTGYRFSKFVKRNRPQMIAASLILLALICGIIGTSWGLLRARAERDEKELARQEAEENFQRTRQVVDDFFTLVSQNNIFNVPGLQPVRRDLLKKARDYYQETYKKRPDDPALLAGLTVAQLRLAAVYFEIDRADDWLMLFAQGVENASRLKTQFPSNREAHRKVVGFWPGLRRMQGQQAMPKDLQLADDTIKRYLALWSQFAQENPDELRFQRDLAIGYGLLGVAYIALGDLDSQKQTIAWNAARNWLDQCIQTFETVLQRVPQDTSCRELLIEALNEQAFLATLLKLPKDKEILQAKADKHSEQLATKNVKIPIYREYLIAKTMRPLKGQIDSGHLKEAETTIQKASQLLSDLVAEQPGTGNYGTVRLRLLNALLEVRQKANQPIDIEPQLEQLIATCRSRLKAWPELPVMLRELTEVLEYAAGYAHERGRTEVAEAHLLELKTVIQSCKLPMENEVDHNERVGSWYLFQLSQFYRDAGKQAERAGALLQAATIFKELTRHKSPRTSLHWRRLAETQKELGQYDLALESINQSLALHARNNDAYHVRGEIHQLLQQNVKAIEDYSKALEIDQENEWTWANRAWCHLQLGQLESAAADYRKAIGLKPEIAVFHSVLGDVLMKLGRKEEAVKSHQRAWELEPNNQVYKKKLAEMQADLKEKKSP